MNGLLTQEQFVKLAKEGKIKVMAKLFEIGHQMDKNHMKMVECEVKPFYDMGYDYKVELVHEQYEYEQRDIYTCTLVSFINEGIFELIFKEFYIVKQMCPIFSPDYSSDRPFIFTEKHLAEGYMDMLYSLEKSQMDCLQFSVEVLSEDKLTQATKEGFDLIDGLSEDYEPEDLMTFGEIEIERMSKY